MQGIFQKENTDKALKYGIYRHLPTYEKIIRNLVSFSYKKQKKLYGSRPERRKKFGSVSFYCDAAGEFLSKKDHKIIAKKQR